MRNFFSGTKFKITAAILASLLLGIFIAAVSGSGVSPLSEALGILMTPLNSAAQAINERLGEVKAGFTSSAAYREQIEALNAEIESYRAELADYEKLRQKLNSYEAFLEVREENPDYTFEPASVIMRDASDIYSSFTINKGRADGLEIDQPVICGKHLVGVIKKLNETSAVVCTLTDPSVSVSAYEIRTREDCYTECDTELAVNGLIRLSGLSRSTPVVPGGIVCTSGIGGIFPRDLIIGTVIQVNNSETDISAYATVEPDIDLGSLVDVFVITDFEEESK